MPPAARYLIESMELADSYRGGHRHVPDRGLRNCTYIRMDRLVLGALELAHPPYVLHT